MWWTPQPPSHRGSVPFSEVSGWIGRCVLRSTPKSLLTRWSAWLGKRFRIKWIKSLRFFRENWEPKVKGIGLRTWKPNSVERMWIWVIQVVHGAFTCWRVLMLVEKRSSLPKNSHVRHVAHEDWRDTDQLQDQKSWGFQSTIEHGHSRDSLQR